MTTLAADNLPIRRLARGERRPVLEVFAGLSDRSRRRRLLWPKPTLSESDLRHLVDVGCCGRQAVAATDRVTAAAVGIARYVRLGADPTAAEVAFEVVDEWQGKGVGRRLADELRAVASAVGMRRLHATVAGDNPPGSR